jgi:carboxylesterase
MARHAWLDPSAFHLEGGPNGALLLHGLPGSPAEMRPLGEYLAEHGFTVTAPLLPGHGTTVQDLARVRWPDWAAAVAEAHGSLASQCQQVFVAGLSLGSLLALNLAAGRPVDGIVLYSPAILISNPLFRLSRLYGWIPAAIPHSWTNTGPVDPESDRRTWHYERIPLSAIHQVHLLTDHVRQLLPAVTAPALIFMGHRDESIKPESGRVVFDKIGSPDKELITLAESGHNPLIGQERELVYQRTAEFFARLSGE